MLRGVNTPWCHVIRQVSQSNTGSRAGKALAAAGLSPHLAGWFRQFGYDTTPD